MLRYYCSCLLDTHFENIKILYRTKILKKSDRFIVSYYTTHENYEKTHKYL